MGSHAPLAMANASRRSKWLVVDTKGEQSSIHADKRTLIQLYDITIPIRDMRWLDPNLTSANRGNIAVRDAAIVFSIDYVQVIITAERAILPQNALRRPEHAEFVDKLLAVVREAYQARCKVEEEGDRASLDSGSLAASYNPDLPFQPFELVVLEAALKEICASYATKAKQLEAIINPACDALLKKVQTKTLENLRRLKTRHQRLMSSVTTVREELEGFLKDDDDISKMCLTRKMELARGPAAPGVSLSLDRSLRRSLTTARAGSGGGGSAGSGGQLQRSESSGRSPEEQAEYDAELEAEATEEVENLLESYFIQIDLAFNRLQSLEEYMKDTEDFIYISLDSNQNRLFRLDIVLTAAAFSLEIFHVMGGILGENVPIPHQITQNVEQFWMVNLGTVAVCMMVFAALYSWLRYKRLLL